MAASDMVRLQLQFDSPPPVTRNCTVFWLLVDTNRCQVVTDLIRLIRQRFGFSSGAVLGLYLDGRLLPPAESARLVRDNDRLRVKLEDGEVPELPAPVSSRGDTHFLPVKAGERPSKLEADPEAERGRVLSEQPRKRRENSRGKEEASEPHADAVPGGPVRKKSKRGNEAACDNAGDDEDGETRRKSPTKKRECEKQTKNRGPPKAQAVLGRSAPSCSPGKGSAGNLVGKARRKGGGSAEAEDSPASSSGSESSCGSGSDRLSSATPEAGSSPEKLAAELPKEGPSAENTAANKLCTKAALNLDSGKGKAPRASSSSSSLDSSWESGDEPVAPKLAPERWSSFSKTAGLLSGRAYPGPGPSPRTPAATGWKPSDPSHDRQPVPLPSFGRGWGRGEDFVFWKGARGQGQALSCVLNKNSECQKQQQLHEIVTNSSTIIQLLELTSDYSPDVSDYKEGKLLSHNPETQQVDIEILSALPAVKEPGKFDLVYHNENGTEVVEYAVMQEKKITVFWRELIDPRLIIEPTSTTSSTELQNLTAEPHGL
uniref:Coilin n=1 Tax=Chinchilla lanigera TaxID=34839 RepID=A0A8C2V5Y3_CHILA